MLPDDVHLDLRLDTERRYGNGMIGLQYELPFSLTTGR